MPTRCICYTTDETYLFPTLVSALQARRHAGIDTADVWIVCFDVDRESEAVFTRSCGEHGIRLLALPGAAIEGAPAMLARLFLDRLLPPEYSQILYIDGDTQVTGSLDPLLECVVPAGHFMAANDPMTFAVPGGGRHGAGIARHFRSIGLRPDEFQTYFNTGVLRLAREGWDPIGQEAWRQFRQTRDAVSFPDQDVLNRAGAKYRLPMSLAWNFPIFMLNAGVASHVSPRILHFMSQPKPWHGVFPPWSAAAHAAYLDVVRGDPQLAAYHTRMPMARRLKYHLQQRYKKLLETLTWRLSVKRTRILQYEARCPTLGRHPL